MPQLDFSTYLGQIIWLAISFSILYVLVSKLILPKIGTVVEGRAAQIGTDLQQAEDLQKQAEDADNKASQILGESSNKARGLISESSSKAKSKIEAKRAELATKLEQKIAKAESEITKIEKESVEAVEKVSKELASQIADKILKAA